MPDNIREILINIKATKDTSAFEKIAGELDQLGKGSKLVVKDINALGDVTSTTFRRIVDEEGNVFLGVKKSLTVTNKALREFRMEWLSVMFFSMGAQRKLVGVMKNSISAFTKIAGESNRANQAIVSLQAQFTYLKFTIGSAIGEALIPVLPALAEFIEKIVDFVDKHPDEVFWGLATAIGVFAGAFVLGQLALFADALFNIFTRATAAEKAIKSLGVIAQELKYLPLAASITFVIKDIFFDKKGDFEPEDKLFASGFFAMFKKGGIMAKFKAGGIVFTILSAIEFLEDPEGTGKFVADFANYMFKIADTLTSIIDSVFSYIYSKITGATFDTSKFASFKAFREGFSNEINRLRESGEISTSLNQITLGLSGNRDAFNEAIKSASFFKTTVESSVTSLLPSIMNLGFYVGSPTKGSYPIVYSLIQAQLQWVNMSAIAVSEIEKVINKLNQIPREIVTVHRIVTVEERRGGISYLKSRL